MYVKFIPVSIGCFLMFIFIFPHNIPGASTGKQDIKTRIESYLQTGETLLKEGDIVLRMNKDPFSEFIRYFNKKDKNFSHAGLVVRDSEELMIYHMASEDGNPMKLMRKQSLADFADPHHNFGYAIYRYKLTKPELNTIREQVKNWYNLPVHFDTAFNLTSDNELYCSEMVQKAITKGTYSRIKIHSTTLNTLQANAIRAYYKLNSQSGMKIIAIDDLYVNAECRKIAQYTF